MNGAESPLRVIRNRSLRAEKSPYVRNAPLAAAGR